MCRREAYETMILRAIIHPFLIGWSLHHPSAVETWKIDQQYTEGFRELSKHPGGSCSPPVRGCRDLHSLGHLSGAGAANVGLMSSLGFMRSLQKSRLHPLDWKIFGEFPDGTFLRASEREQSANLGLPALESGILRNLSSTSSKQMGTVSAQEERQSLPLPQGLGNTTYQNSSLVLFQKFTNLSFRRFLEPLFPLEIFCP